MQSAEAATATAAKLIFCIVDLHAITQRQDAATLRRNKKEMLVAILAMGIDPQRCILFEQSRVLQHSELMWILSCGASTGYLGRMTQWKVCVFLHCPSVRNVNLVLICVHHEMSEGKKD